MTYDEAIFCPRCRLPGVARTEEVADAKGCRMTMVRCLRLECPYYKRTWFFAMDAENTVLYHTLYNT